MASAEKKLKYLFIALSFLLLVLMIFMGRNSGVNCDELLHYNHSIAVIDFYRSHGADTSALNTPVTHLKYYGQSYDNLTTLIQGALGIEDTYGFRHFMSSIAGWLAIIITALLAIWFDGYLAGIIVIVLFVVSPTYLGHAQNNLKDIPFALAYISGILFSFRLLSEKSAYRWSDILLLVLSAAFCLSIRPGGLLLICYLFLFFSVVWLSRIITDRSIDIQSISRGVLLVVFISLASFFLGILFWPYALVSPFSNVIESYRAMVHFPDTFRQIFEGREEWSDFMPWYYIPKSMLITVPMIVWTGCLLFFIFIKDLLRKGKIIWWILLLFTIVFPIIMVIASRSNLYSSWRHFLFIYPPLVIVAAHGITSLIRSTVSFALRLAAILVLCFLLIHPALYLIRNSRYAYVYYNQFIGGIKGALGRYETDYYYVSQKESAEWLLKYLKQNGRDDTVTVASNFSAEWFFRHDKNIKNRYVRFEERSMHPWDFAIITNRYISPFQLRTKLWPPSGALHVVYADGVPLSAVIERKSDASVRGWVALQSGRNEEAASSFAEAAKSDSTDEMIFYNFAVALSRKGEYSGADSLLKTALRLNPDFDLALMFLGDLALEQGNKDEAAGYYEKTILANRKYEDAYIELARILAPSDRVKTRRILKDCLEISPLNREAIKLLADTYRETDPGVAEKYDEFLKTLK